MRRARQLLPEAAPQEEVHQEIRRLPRMYRQRHLRPKQQRLWRQPRRVSGRRKRQRRQPWRVPKKQKRPKKWGRAYQTNPQRLLKAPNIQMRNRDREAAARAAPPQNLPAAIPQRPLRQRSLAPVPPLAPNLIPAATALTQEARTTARARLKAVRTRAAQASKKQVPVSKAGSGI